MCGICASFALERPESHDALERATSQMVAQMKRRGPDDEGKWCDERCALGFRRLAILDLSANGHQPMMTVDQRYVLVFNGEVYNFKELRSRLEERGIRFRSTGDAEVVLYALAVWGPEALALFNGMFALAFYDAVAQQLLFARDHAGIKPLYYLRTTQGLVVASQYDQIIHHPWAKGLSVSQDALSLYFRFGYIPAPHAMLARTHLLDAGCWLRMDGDGRLERGRFFDFPRFVESTLHGPAAYEALDDVLQRAVARHLISDVPVGVFLSGGIDSPLVAAEASRSQSRIPTAFTVSTPTWPSRDEGEDARKYAAELELTHIVADASEHDVFRLVDAAMAACSEPTADVSILATLMVSEVAGRHVKVVLAGDGGDELFWGYSARFGDVLEEGAGVGRSWRDSARAMGRRYLKGRDQSGGNLSIGQRYEDRHTVFRPVDLASVFPALAPIPEDFDLFAYDGRDPDEAAQWLRWNEFRLHLARVLLKVDRASMYHSLEVRVPLLDKEVIEVAIRTDWRSCLDVPRRLGKIPLRVALARRVNHQTVEKKGFDVPVHDWLAGPLRSMLEDKVFNRREFCGQPVHAGAVRNIYDRLVAGEERGASPLWLLLSLSLWEEHHLH